MDFWQLMEKERKNGCTDMAVFGGFAAYCYEWAAKEEREDLMAIASRYAAASPAKRPEILAELAARWPEQAVAEAAPLTQPAPKRKTPAKKPAAKAETAAAPAAPAADALAQPLTKISGVGEKRAQIMAKLGINNIGDLLAYYPRAYQDRSAITPAAELVYDQPALLRMRVRSCSLARVGRLTILKAVLFDDTGAVTAVWFNQPFLQRQLTRDRELVIYGKWERRYNRSEFMVSEYEFVDGGDYQPGIVPLYRLTEGVTQKYIRQLMSRAWQGRITKVPELLPEYLREKYSLPERGQAMFSQHFPLNFAERERGRRRLAYEELLLLQLAIVANSENRGAQPGYAMSADPGILQRFCDNLPYALTGAQQRVIGEIYADMEKPLMMSRLVQGDVGCGKTAVAAAAIYKALASGWQAAMMAPTELLAAQHYRNLRPMLADLGFPVEFLSGSTSAREKRRILALAASGEPLLLVGTHALIQDGVELPRLGLAVTDEQHRFGVMQRAALSASAQADVLVMTATPIPRTLALTLYSDLDFSVIDELPPGRQPVRTDAVSYDYEERVHRFIRKQVENGRQVFVVCPMIEDSEDSDLSGAVSLYERLQKDVFPDLRVALLHGQLKPKDKNAVMDAFVGGEVDILVSTTVVEVGVDVPNASLMVIRDAERFGLAQLHQLRGRIGRGGGEAFCVLLHNAQSEVARQRMRTICECADGFTLAEADLQQRGPGEIFGTRQSGLPELKVADLYRDRDLLLQAREDAQQLLRDGVPAPLQRAAEEKRQQLCRS